MYEKKMFENMNSLVRAYPVIREIIGDIGLSGIVNPLQLNLNDKHLRNLGYRDFTKFNRCIPQQNYGKHKYILEDHCYE